MFVSYLVGSSKSCSGRCQFAEGFFLPCVCTPTVSNRVLRRHGVPACVGPQSRHGSAKKRPCYQRFKPIEYYMTYLANLWAVHGIPRSAAQRASWLKTSALRYTWHIMPTSRKEVRLRSLRAPPHTPQRDENITRGVLPEHAEVSQKALGILLHGVLYHVGRTVLSCLCICTGRPFGFVTLAGRRSPSTTDALAKLKFDHMCTVCHMSTVFLSILSNVQAPCYMQ